MVFVEFTLASLLFLPITLGTIDFGRAVYEYTQLHNAVREGARFGKVQPTNLIGIRNEVLAMGVGLNMTAGDITAGCTGGCYPGART